VKEDKKIIIIIKIKIKIIIIISKGMCEEKL
jgi:hypothetical protein